MSKIIFEEDNFYKYAIDFFKKAGHINTSIPEFKNHTPKEFLYFDNSSDIALDSYQRSLFDSFDNISRLFTIQNCAFFSINLLTTKKNRSQIAHDIHTMIHPFIDTRGTICIFNLNDELMLSFMGFGYNCILSDWYSVFDDYGEFLRKLDIANFSVNSNLEYFQDMVYILERDYYKEKIPLRVEIVPAFFLDKLEFMELERYEITKLYRKIKLESQRSYGDDFVEYQNINKNLINSDLDQLIIKMEQDSLLKEENSLNQETSIKKPIQKSEYKYDNVNPEIFDDPTLLLKWIQDLGN